MRFNIIKFKEIDSTNNYCLSNIETLNNHDVVVAETQTGGRGRLNRKWISPAGKNLYFTAVLKSDDLKVEDTYILPQIAGLSLYETIKPLGFEKVWVKWPNDLYCGQKKMAGILCESRFKGCNLQAVIIGIGLNINSTKEDFEELDSPATSLLIESKDQEGYVIDEVLSGVLMNLGKNLNQLKTDREGLRDRWQNAGNLIGKEVEVFNETKRISGFVTEYTSSGGLIIRTSMGYEEVNYGDLSLRCVQ